MSKRPFWIFALVVLGSAPPHVAAEGNADRVPVLLELFTSEGCSSCPPADRLLEFLDEKQPVAGADLIVLSEHVDYWDGGGWQDPFSSSQFTARQQAYTNQYHFDGVYTPQLVVDGRFGFVGSNGKQAAAAIQKALGVRKIPIRISKITSDGKHVTVRIDWTADEANKGSKAVVYVALADNRRESQVAGGENGGHSLAHVAVTRVLKEVGTISPGTAVPSDATFAIPKGSGEGRSRIVAFIQDPKSGYVLGVAQQKF